MTILKTSFSNNLAICFSLDARYCDSQKSTSLFIYLFIEKQISDKDTI